MKINESLQTYRTEKRKEIEEKASMVIADAAKARSIKNILERGVKAR